MRANHINVQTTGQGKILDESPVQQHIEELGANQTRAAVSLVVNQNSATETIVNREKEALPRAA